MGDCFAPLGPCLLPWDLMAQTDTPTHGHGDSMTNLAQWGRVGENYACPYWQEYIGLECKSFVNVSQM